MKRLLGWTLAAVLLMIGGPWLALRFPGMDAMGVCFLLFFAVNPVFATVCGGVAGWDIRRLWSLPLFVAGLYVAGVWLFFELGEPAFLLYAAGYLLIGAVVMLISAFIKRRKK